MMYESKLESANRRIGSPRHRSRSPILAAAWTYLWVITVLIPSVHADVTLLGTKRWQEHSHGISLLPPLGSRLISQTADDAITRIVGDTGYTINMYIKKSSVDLGIQTITPKAIHQLGTLYPSAIILHQDTLHLHGRPGVVIYFKIPDKKRGDWVMGQAFIQLDPRTFVMLKLEVDNQRFQEARKIYEAVIHSVEMQDPEELDQLRAQQISNGEAWLKQLTPARIHQAIRPDEWLRIVENNQDIGYMCIKNKTDTSMGLPGVRVDIQTRFFLGKNIYDSTSNFFASDDGTQEFWSVRTTVRPIKPALAQKTNAPANVNSWAETGVRSNNKITVSLERPSGIEKNEWQQPPQGYLSQIKVHLLDRLLGNQDSQVMGFYTYHPNSQKIVYRTTSVQTAPDGTIAIHARPSPEQDEYVTYYNPDGRFIKRVLPGGRSILPATQKELAVKWRF